jgi:hypothetical protein
MTPLERFALDRARVSYLPPHQANDELFFVEEERHVRADNTVSFKSIRFERRRPTQRVVVYYKGERMGEARPLDPVANDRPPTPRSGAPNTPPPSSQLPPADGSASDQPAHS